MRTFEAIYLVSLLAICLQNFAQKGRFSSTQIGYVSVAIALQNYLEGMRWQLKPASIAAILLISAEFVFSGTGHPMTLLKLITILAILLSIALSSAMPIFQLPVQDGPFESSFLEFEWTDSTRPIWIKPWLKMQEQDAERRTLFVRIYYPIKKGTEGVAAEYFPHLWTRGPAQAAQFKLPDYLLNHFIHIQGLSKQSANDTPIPIASPPNLFPVIVFSHGYSGSHDQNSVLLTHLVTLGYIVVSLDHTMDASITVLPKLSKTYYFDAAPRESWDQEGVVVAHGCRHRHLMMRSADLSFVLDQLTRVNNGSLSEGATLKGKLDLDNVGLLGHSFGGGTVLVALEDERFKCAMAMDAWTWALTPSQLAAKHVNRQPVLCVQSELWYSPDTEWGRHNDDQVQNFVDQVGSDAWHLRLKDAKHFDWTDIGLYAPYVTRKLGLTNLKGDLMQSVMFDLSREFFGRNLKHEAISKQIFENPSSYYPGLFHFSNK
jgi:hypothetical protein